MRKFWLMSALAGLALGACSGQDSAAPANTLALLKGDNDAAALSAIVDGLCDEITGGQTQVQSSADQACLNCASSENEQAIDGADATFATLHLETGLSGTLSLRATAQPGLVYPAGSRPGVSFSAPQNESNIEVVIRTYLGGVEQEQDCEQSAHFDDTGRLVVGIEATKPFDALEATLQRRNAELANTDCGVSVLSASNPNDVVRPVQLRVHEFCHEFRFPQE